MGAKGSYIIVYFWRKRLYNLGMNYSRETLVAELRHFGITYLAPSDAVASEVVPSTDELLLALVGQTDSRLQLALVPLFIRHPHLMESVEQLCDQLDEGLSLDLKTLYMAAVYLQRLWQIRLRIYLIDIKLLPDLFSEQMGLPPAEERFGKPGLYDLAETWKERSKYPFNRLAALNSTFELFMEHLKLEERDKHYAAAG